MWSDVTKSIVPFLTPFCKAFTSAAVLNGGITLYCVSKSSSASSVIKRLCAATLQKTCSPFFLASAISFTEFAVDIVGIKSLPPVYSKMNKSLATCNSSARAGIPFKPSLVLVMPSFTIPLPDILLSNGKENINPPKF